MVGSAIVGLPRGLRLWLLREGVVEGSRITERVEANPHEVGFPRGAEGLGGRMGGCVVVEASVPAPVTRCSVAKV